MTSLHLAIGTGIALAGATAAGATPPPLTVERVFAAPDISGPVARGVALSPDGKLVTFLQSKASDPTAQDLWAAPASGDGPARLLVDAAALGSDSALSEAEKARRERQRIANHGVVEYKWDDQGARLLVPVSGELFIADIGSGKVDKRIARDAAGGDATDARFSPKGGFLSFVRNGTLYIAPAAAGAPRAITPAAHDAISYGVAEFVAQEEMARDTGYWWRPDDGAIAYTMVDESQVGLVERVDIGVNGTSIIRQRFPRAGRANAKVSLFVQALAGGKPVAVDLGTNPDIYLARVHWSVDGRTLYVERQSRDQQTLDLLAVDPASGASRVILSEHQTPWVNLTLDFTPLDDGGFLWVSERTGYRHLYLYDADARLVRAVTSGDFPLGGVDRVPSLVGVDQARRLAYVIASKDTALEQHLYAVDYRHGGPMQRLTQGAGWWTIRMGKAANAFIGSYSSPDTPPQTALYAADGARQRWIVENRLDASHPYFPYVAGLPKPEFGQLTAEDGQKLDYMLMKPTNFVPGRRYPAIIDVYGGPGRQKVLRNWQAPSERLYLEAGFVVFQLDNRGAANRGLRFEAPIAGKLGTPEVADQLVGLAFLKSLPFVDPARIGVTGWSYGGFMTLRLLTEPGAGFAAGAAGAAPGMWQMYDTHYTERFLGKPQDHPAAYVAAAVLPRLGNLDGRLLLLHGMADDNVLFENATQIMGRLQSRAQPFDLMLFPGQRHGIVGEAPRVQLWRTYLEFFGRMASGPGALQPGVDHPVDQIGAEQPLGE